MGGGQGIDGRGRRSRAGGAVALCLVALCLASCGSAPEAAGPPSSTAVSAPAGGEFTRQAAAACLRARGGAELPKRLPTGVGLSAYARRSLAIAQQTVASLRKLHPPAGPQAAALKRLLVGYRSLIGAYAQAAGAAVPGQGLPGRALRGLERSVKSAAEQTGLPQCAPGSV